LLLVHGYGSSLGDRSSPPQRIRSHLLEPQLLTTTLSWFRRNECNWIDWRGPTVFPVYHTALTIAHRAEILASYTRSCDPDAAWTAGLLAPLGWFAALAVDSSAYASAMLEPLFGANPLEVQQRLWGMDYLSIGRRLARHWKLPDWLRVVVGHLDLPVSAAEALGADPNLFAVVQLAVTMAEEKGNSLGLAYGIDREVALAQLPLNVDDLRAVEARFNAVELSEIFDPDWQDPSSDESIRVLLQKTLERRRAEAAPYLGPLERDIDRLHRMVVAQRFEQEDRLKNAKLEALAEFAAGASHEINNPLAVISGQGQYLLQREKDDRRQKALQSIIRQTQRIHSILTELMYFARPPQPQKQPVVLAEIVKNVADSFQPMADELGVALEKDAVDQLVKFGGDARLLQTALGCLVRNGIEAAAAKKGWVKLKMESVPYRRVDMIVEDSGPGLDPAQREHMFDPFYSGRSAGRGRGLGLPTAWRLAQEHGGDVRYIPVPGGPTRFILSLPLPSREEGIEDRKIA
jgi:signal transduction histidine kinase